MKQLIIVLALALTVAGCKEQGTESNVQLISVEEARELTGMEDVQLVDVRTPEEYAEGHIANAINIDYFSDSFLEEMEKLDKTKPVIVYCRSGNRSGKCIALLKESGFVQLYDIDGGIVQWEDEGLAVEIDP